MSQTASTGKSPLGQSEANLRLLFDGLREHAVFAIDPSGVVSSWPGNAESVFGWTAEEALGKNANFLLTPENRLSHFYDQQMQEALREGKSNEDGWYLKKNGTRFWGTGTMYPLLDASDEHLGFVRILSDRTEEHLRYQQTLLRKEELEGAFAERTAQLRANEERWSSTFQHAAVGMSLSDPATGKFLEVNDKLCQMLDYTAEELRNLTFYELTHPDDLSETRRVFEDLVAERIPSFSLVKRSVRHDGSVFWVNLSVALARDAKGRPKHSVAVVEDITARLNAESELRSTNDELRRANAELEQFAYVSSHDLQEPLRTVQVYTDLFFRRYDVGRDSIGKQYADYITESVARMQRLIDDLLEYSRTIHTEKHEEYRPVPIDLNAALRDGVAGLQQQIQRFNAVITSDVLPIVKADRELISQVFQSLISNALKFRRPDEPPRIHVFTKTEQGEAIICVQDNGIGFEEKYAQRIFGLFKRLHRHEYTGTGLGLAIAKRIIDRYGGRIWANSEVGHGSTFCFTLPQV
jgi:PAS domain S-box-containing protein